MGALWHPNAVRRVHIDAGGFQGGGHKIVWHTTETSNLPNYGGSAPHFTLDPATGRLWQHIPLNHAARALKAGGPNFWNTIQVELLGFAKQSHTWPVARYKRIAKLARWIEANFAVPRKVQVVFKGNDAPSGKPGSLQVVRRSHRPSACAGQRSLGSREVPSRSGA